MKQNLANFKISFRTCCEIILAFHFFVTVLKDLEKYKKWFFLKDSTILIMALAFGPQDRGSISDIAKHPPSDRKMRGSKSAMFND